MFGELARWRATEKFLMSDPDPPISGDDTTFGRDTRALILRIVVVACLGVLAWQTIIAAGSP
jgi:hypothetical protein